MNMPFLTMQALLGTDKRPPNFRRRQRTRTAHASHCRHAGRLRKRRSAQAAPCRRGTGRLRAGGVPAAPRRLRPPRALPAGTPRVRRQGRRHRRIAPSPFQRLRPYAP
ncbi:MAG: hypothetical protein ACLR0N_11215 [Bilophila wadsworthia]